MKSSGNRFIRNSALLRRLLQPFDQRLQPVALLSASGKLNEQLRHQVRPVVQEVVFLQRAVARGLHGQLGVLSQTVEADGLIDDVAVTPLEAMVDSAFGRNEIGKACGGDGVGHNRRTGMLSQQDR